MRCSILPQPVALLKLMLVLFRVIDIPWKDLYLTQLNFMKYSFNIGQHLDTKEMCFKLNMSLDMTLHFHTSLNDLDLHSKSQG